MINKNNHLFVRDFAGHPGNECEHCGALMFEDEISRRNTSLHYCCHHGLILLRFMNVSIPPFLNDLLHGDAKVARNFRHNIRQYNNLFAFTSMKANLDETLANQKIGVYTFRISGV